jgi:hypothetical protein
MVQILLVAQQVRDAHVAVGRYHVIITATMAQQRLRVVVNLTVARPPA